MLNNRNPVYREIDAACLPIEGRLPPGLQGTLYRNGPNPRAGEASQHWFLGQGMIHAISLGGGQATYRNRWVIPQKNLTPQLGKANTHVIAHAGTLMALEEAHAPVLLGPDTLAFHGHGSMTGRFTAHPKHDPATGALVFFAYAADGRHTRTIRCGSLDAHGHLGWETCFEAPFCSMVHDAAVTARHIALPVLPLAAAPALDEGDTLGFAWQPELGGHLAVLRRGAYGSEVRWHEAPPVHAFHIANAWEEHDRLFLDLFVYDVPPLFPTPGGVRVKAAPARPCRWSVALEGREPVRVEHLHDMAGEFPRIDDRHAGRSYDQIYYASRSGVEQVGFQAITRLDLSRGAIDQFDFGLAASVSEPVFVPRGDDAPIDDGWLMSTVWRPEWAGSKLVVFDAGHVADGPVAAVILPQRVPDGFHGSFVPDVFLDLEKSR